MRVGAPVLLAAFRDRIIKQAMCFSMFFPFVFLQVVFCVVVVVVVVVVVCLFYVDVCLFCFLFLICFSTNSQTHIHHQPTNCTPWPEIIITHTLMNYVRRSLI